MLKSNNRRKIKLSSYTKGGRISSVIVLFSCLILIVSILWSYINKGQAGAIVGYTGMFAFLLNVAGFIIGLNSFKEEGLWLKYSWIGTIANATLGIAMLSIIMAFV